jgi:hypothetical protein
MSDLENCETCKYTIPGLSKPAGKGKCRGWSVVNGIRADMDKAFLGCSTQLTVSDTKISDTFKSNAEDSAFTDHDFYSTVAPSPFVVDDDATELAAALPTITDEDKTEYKPFCMSFKQDPTSEHSRANYDVKTSLMQFQAMKTSEKSLKETLFFQAYFTEPGRKPFIKIGDKNVITATEVLWPGKGQITQATLSMESVIDTTSNNAKNPNRVYNDTATYVYHAVVSAQPMQTSYYDHSINNGAGQPTGGFSNDIILSANMLTFGSFVFREITIRDKTPAEIWAEIGGIWAACAGVLIMFYAQSGHVKPTDEAGNPGKELMVFRWQTGGMKKAALAPYQKKGEQSVENDVAQLQKQLAQQQEQLAQLTASIGVKATTTEV